MSDLKQNVDGGGSGIIETKPESIRSGCGDTTSGFVRNCPSCDSEITYKTKNSYGTALRNPHRLCKRCKQRGKTISQETRIKLSWARIGKGHPHTAQHKQNIKGNGNPMYGVHRYDTLNPFYGRCHTEEAKRKMRVATCKRILKIQRASNGRINHVGRAEGIFFDALEKQRGWNGTYYSKSGRQHFLEDLGYFVDYYEPNLNIVVEYDEPRHYRRGVLREKDRKRMNEIKAHLGCQFLRFNEYTSTLKLFC